MPSLRQVFRSWKVLYHDLDSINIDFHSTQSKEMRKRAKDLYTVIYNKFFLSLLVFLVDLLEILSKWSKHLHKNNILLIGQTNIQTTILNNLESLKTTDGTCLTTFLQIANCGDDHEVCDTLDNYEQSGVKYKLYI